MCDHYHLASNISQRSSNVSYMKRLYEEAFNTKYEWEKNTTKRGFLNITT